MFDALEVALQVVATLRRPMESLRRIDGGLHDQIRRAATSVCLNLAEGRRRVGRDRVHHWRIAAGSADELSTALRVAEAWGTLNANDLESSRQLLDRVLAMLWRLTHERVRGS